MKQLSDLVKKCRTYRRFFEEERVERSLLKELVELARLTPSAANKQPLKYLLLNSREECAALFPHLRWAGYLKEWDGPQEGERPAAYILIFADKSLSKNVDCDHGIASQTIMLGAVERGLGGTIFGAVDRKSIVEEFSIDSEQFDLLLVLGLGKPKETVLIKELPDSGSIQYWRDKEGNHYVPKRNLDDIIIS